MFAHALHELMNIHVSSRLDSSVGEGSGIQTLIGQRNRLEMVNQTPR